jgi:2,3-bisphosphoglycerate-dependent phosphoglycerate mutase
MAYLVLVRHGQSEWNALGLWTGLTDIPLSEQGRKEAQDAAKQLSDIKLHKAHTSKLVRAQQTLEEIKEALTLTGLETIEHEALNERHYGDYTAKNKWDVEKEIGTEEFTKLRRNWDHPVPNGETLKDVHARAVPYYEQHILADLKDGKNIIVAAHGNTLRALMKYLDKVADDKVHEIEIGTAGVIIYEIAEDGSVLNKEIRSHGAKA